jgi:hypothetical protein
MKFSKKLINQRFLFYKNLPYIKKHPFFSIRNKFANELEALVQVYLSQNLISIGKRFKDLNSSIDDIMKLPNITPGGIVVPKIETQLIYNAIASYCYKSLGDFSKYTKSFAPVTIRVKSGKIKSPDRPYETSKLHSDAWVGMFGDGIISFGIMGDFKNNGVEFFMPNLISADYFGKLSNYDEGINKFKGLKEIGRYKKGFIHLFDNIVLHKTMSKKNSLPRVSIDFGFFLKKKSKVSNFFNADIKRYRFDKADVYNECGNKFYYKTFETITQTRLRIINGKKKVKVPRFVKI